MPTKYLVSNKKSTEMPRNRKIQPRAKTSDHRNKSRNDTHKIDKKL